MRSVHVLVLVLCGLAVASAFNVPALVRRCFVGCDARARRPFRTLFPAPCEVVWRPPSHSTAVANHHSRVRCLIELRASGRGAYGEHYAWRLGRMLCSVLLLGGGAWT